MTVTSSNLTQYIKLIKTDDLAKAIDTGVILLMVYIKNTCFSSLEYGYHYDNFSAFAIKICSSIY